LEIDNYIDEKATVVTLITNKTLECPVLDKNQLEIKCHSNLYPSSHESHIQHLYIFTGSTNQITFITGLAVAYVGISRKHSVLEHQHKNTIP
jgi:hypothetical protein